MYKLTIVNVLFGGLLRVNKQEARFYENNIKSLGSLIAILMLVTLAGCSTSSSSVNADQHTSENGGQAVSESEYELLFAICLSRCIWRTRILVLIDKSMV